MSVLYTHMCIPFPILNCLLITSAKNSQLPSCTGPDKIAYQIHCVFHLQKTQTNLSCQVLVDVITFLSIHKYVNLIKDV